MDRIEHDQSNENAESMLRAVEDVTDAALLCAAGNAAQGPSIDRTWPTGCR
jgi:hypothetical protein